MGLLAVVRVPSLFAVTAVALMAGCAKGSLNPNTAPDANSHVKYFPIQDGVPHAGIDCNTCHGEYDTFTQFDCLNGCHALADVSPGHAGVSEFEYSSAACYKCHPDGAGVDHEKVFPIAAGQKHAALACGTCHRDGSNRKNVTCTASDCHAQADIATGHASVRDDHTQSTECLACHADSQVNPVASHPGDPGPSHHRANCSTGNGCHKAFRSDKPFGLDFSRTDCSSCHDTASGPSGGG